MVFEILRLNKKNLQSVCISGAIAQFIECLAGEQDGWGVRGPRFDSQVGRNFFHLNLFLRGNEPNVDQQEEQQQLK